VSEFCWNLKVFHCTCHHSCAVAGNIHVYLQPGALHLSRTGGPSNIFIYMYLPSIHICIQKMNGTYRCNMLHSRHYGPFVWNHHHGRFRAKCYNQISYHLKPRLCKYLWSVIRAPRCVGLTCSREFRCGTPHREIDQHCSGPTMVYQGEQSISPFKLAQTLGLINHAWSSWCVYPAAADSAPAFILSKMYPGSALCLNGQSACIPIWVSQKKKSRRRPKRPIIKFDRPHNYA
jgi:hypothetical protein